MNAHAFKTFFVLDDRPDEALPELSHVRTLVEIIEGDVRVPRGTMGTIVLVNNECTAYEVEFTSPIRAVVGALRSEVEPA